MPSVLHNCADRKCELSNTCIVCQEHEAIAQQEQEVSHINLEDVVLNCFKMNNYKHILHLFPVHVNSDQESMIVEGSVREIVARWTRAQKVAAAAETVMNNTASILQNLSGGT